MGYGTNKLSELMAHQSKVAYVHERDYVTPVFIYFIFN
jgi:hypothetical protein